MDVKNLSMKTIGMPEPEYGKVVAAVMRRHLARLGEPRHLKGKANARVTETSQGKADPAPVELAG